MNGQPPANRLIARIARVSGLVPAPILLFLGALLVGLAAVVELRSEPALRFAGMFWQLVGLGLVFNQIVATAKLFGRPGPRRALEQWIERIKRAWAGSRILHASVNEVTVALEGLQARASAGYLTVDLDQRIRQIEENLGRLATRVEAVHLELHQTVQDTDARLSEDLNRATGRLEELSTRLERYAAGDLLGAMVGALLTLVGLVLASASPELARLMFCS